MDGAALILKKDGLTALNTNAVAHKAGVSIGSLYQYFPSKDAILATLVRQMRREMLEAMQDALERATSGDIRKDGKIFIEASLRHHLDHADIVEQLEHVEKALPLDQETQALKSEMSELVVALLERCNVTDARAIAFDLISICHALSHDARALEVTSFEQISQRMQRAVFGYIDYKD